MSLYKITNNTLGERIASYFPNGRFNTWVTSVIPTGDAKKVDEKASDKAISLKGNLKPIAGSERFKIINSRIPRHVSVATLAIGDPDFLPFSFLERGLRCGKAVCRILRSFSVGELIDLLERRNYVVKEIPEEILKPLLEKIGINLLSLWTDKTISEVKQGQIFKAQIQSYSNDIIIIPVATGFLVGRNYLITNQHVLLDKSLLNRFRVQFQYQNNLLINNPGPVEYLLDENFLVSNSELDYALFRVKPLEDEQRKDARLSFQEAGDNFGWLPLYADSKVIAPPITPEEAQANMDQFEGAIGEIDKERIRVLGWSGDAVNLIQHPRGRRKEIVLYNSRVKEIYPELLEYVTDVEPGTSGAPVFNAQWQLTALHHSVLIDVMDENDDNKASTVASISCLGTRISRIVQDLKERDKEENISDFLNEFVIQEGQTPLLGRIFLYAGRKREISTAKDSEFDSNFEALSMKAIGQKVAELVQQARIEIFEVPTNLSDDEAIDWINKHTYQAGDVAIDIRMNNFSDKPKVRGAVVAYFGENRERKSHGEMVLQSLLKSIPTLPARGVVPDWSEDPKGEGLDFCGKVRMPSLVLYLGFLTNVEDCQIIQNDSKDLAIPEGIARGLVEWVSLLSPLSIA
jgi:hypothetical protein